MEFEVLAGLHSKTISQNKGLGKKDEQMRLQMEVKGTRFKIQCGGF